MKIKIKCPRFIKDRMDLCALMERCPKAFECNVTDGIIKAEIEEIRQETLEACEFYGIINPEVSENCVLDWEGERIL